jgi:hypothetical protein
MAIAGKTPAADGAMVRDVWRRLGRVWHAFRRAQYITGDGVVGDVD